MPQECDGQPLIDALFRVVRHVPREEWEREFARGLVLNTRHQTIATSHTVRAGERYLHKFPNVTEPDVSTDIRILHEDEALIVVHKPAPLLMHAAGRYNRNTLQHILHAVYHPERPRQAHRLDANTTGVLLLSPERATSPRCCNRSSPAVKSQKYYLVKAPGSPAEDAFSCDAPISSEPGEISTREVDHEAGLPARTEFPSDSPQSRQRTTLLEARPADRSDRQIRVHLWHLGFPICGDTVYQANQ